MDRRTFITQLSLGLAGVAFSCGAFRPLNAAQNFRKPSVILIYTDDQGSIDTNVYGATDLITPNMDRLARQGVRFTQFYAAAPVCSPSRAALMTGRYPQRAGLPHNAPSMQGEPGMPTEQVTIAEMLQKAGYTTGHVGKWHMGYTPETMPNGQGYHYSFGHMGGCIDNYSHFFYWAGPNRHDLWRNGEEVWYDGEFFGDLMVEECERFISRNQDRPFFLYWAINFPHYPLQGTEKWRQQYRDLPAPRRMYAAFVSTMDEMIGEVLDYLKTLGIREDTIIIFQSDHGHSTEERTFGGGGNAGPYRGAKFSLFEGGIRVPAMISWPGQVPENKVRKQLATNCDWLPTIAEYCKVDLPDRTLDGTSLVPIIRSADAPDAHDIFHWQSGRSEQGPRWAVRKGPWKLLGNPRDTSHKAEVTEDDNPFLANLDKDITEMTNFADGHADIVEELTQLHEEWINEVGVED